MKRKKIIYILLSFSIPIILFLIAMYFNVGEIDGNHIMISDMKGQYVALFQYLKNVLDGTESLFYSFNKGLGGEMFTTITYYLASPLNFLVYFFDSGNIPNCILLIILIKIGLSGLTMNIYLNHRNSSNFSINFLFSLCYALMGYVVNYYFNIMWLDAVYMLPLVIMGLENIVDKNKPLMYIITLSFTIITSYYIGYMICIFNLLYFIYYCLIQKKISKKNIISFLISSILSIGVAAIIIIPTIVKMPEFAVSTRSVELSEFFKYLTGLLQNTLIGGHPCSEVTNEYGSYIYTTVFCFVNVIIYFLNKKISNKNKMLSAIMLFVLFCSMTLSPLIKMWHGFTVPNAFNCREGFIFSFFIIILGHEAYLSFDKIDKEKIVKIIPISLIYVLVCLAFFNQKYFVNICLNLTFIIIYILVLLLKQNKIIKPFLIILVIIELYLNLHISFMGNPETVINYNDYYNNVCDILHNNNYRSENLASINTIDGLTCGYKSSSIFISTLTDADIAFYKNYGYFGYNKMVYNGTGNTQMLNSILGVKYYLLDNNSHKKEFLEKTDKCIEDKSIIDTEKHTYCIYDNQQALSIGYIVDAIEVENKYNVFENQNELLKKMFSFDNNYLKQAEIIDIEEDFSGMTIKNNKNPFYLYLKVNPVFQYYNSLEIYINGEKQYIEEDYPSLSDRVLEIYSEDIITNIEIHHDKKAAINGVEIYQKNYDVSDEYDSFLKKYNEQLKIVKIDRKILKGEITTEKDGYLLLTIPYDRSFKLHIDGKQVSIEKAYDYFISSKINKGKHTIELTYSSRNYYIYALISILFLIINVIFVKKCKKCDKNSKNI